MTETYFHHFTKGDADNEIEICVEYSITGLSPATYWDPAEGGEVEIIKAWIEPGGKDYDISDDENEKWSETIAEEHDHSDCGDDNV